MKYKILLLLLVFMSCKEKKVVRVKSAHVWYANERKANDSQLTFQIWHLDTIGNFTVRDTFIAMKILTHDTIMDYPTIPVVFQDTIYIHDTITIRTTSQTPHTDKIVTNFLDGRKLVRTDTIFLKQ
jgi:hypothetical protein